MENIKIGNVYKFDKTFRLHINTYDTEFDVIALFNKEVYFFNRYDDMRLCKVPLSMLDILTVSNILSFVGWIDTDFYEFINMFIHKEPDEILELIVSSYGKTYNDILHCGINMRKTSPFVSRHDKQYSGALTQNEDIYWYTDYKTGKIYEVAFIYNWDVFYFEKNDNKKWLRYDHIYNLYCQADDLINRYFYYMNPNVSNYIREQTGYDAADRYLVSLLTPYKDQSIDAIIKDITRIQNDRAKRKRLEDAKRALDDILPEDAKTVILSMDKTIDYRPNDIVCHIICNSHSTVEDRVDTVRHYKKDILRFVMANIKNRKRDMEKFGSFSCYTASFRFKQTPIIEVVFSVKENLLQDLA